MYILYNIMGEPENNSTIPENRSKPLLNKCKMLMRQRNVKHKVVHFVFLLKSHGADMEILVQRPTHIYFYINLYLCTYSSSWCR